VNIPPAVHAALITVQLLFASLGVVAKIALREIPPFGLVAFRTPTAALVLVIAARVIARERVAFRHLPALALYGFFGIMANQLLFIAGLQRTTATDAVVIGTSIPVFTVGVAVALRKEKATLGKILGLAIALGGALVVVGGGALSHGGEHALGNLLVLANSLSFAIYLVVSRKLLETYRPITVIAWTLLFGAIGVLPFGAADFVRAAPHLSERAWIAMSYIVVFPTVCTYFLNTWALQRAPSSVVAIYIYVQPVVGALLAAALLGERPGWSVASGAALIAGGIWLVTRTQAARGNIER
jgi:drug/metabolite transporter (DMT)-like permease